MAVPRLTSRPAPPAPPLPPRIPAWTYPAAFTVVLAGGAGVRLWELAGKPGWQYDEGVYTGVAANLLQHGVIAEHITYGSPYSPDLYQPPFYFILLARWFALTGPSVYHARLLGVACSLATLTLFWRLLTRLHGPQAGVLAIIPVTFDGWLLYVQRVSYIENLLLALVTTGMLLYQNALDRTGTPAVPVTATLPLRTRRLRMGTGTAGEVARIRPAGAAAVMVTSRWWPAWWMAAGAVLGFAVAVKYTGTYVLAAVLLSWLICRRAHKGHLILLGTAITVLAGCIALEIRLYDAPGHDWWIQQTMVQIRRVLGLQQSGGTLTSPAAGLHLLFAQYSVFGPSLLIAVLAAGLAVRRVWQCYRARDWAPARGNELLFAWMAAGIVIFGSSSLRYPQYFALILLPMYGFFWTELSRWRWQPAYIGMIAWAAVLAGLLSFTSRVADRDDNVFAQVQSYAATQIPRNAVVVADEAIGDLIRQPYCREQQATPCAGHATWAITWDTYLQSTWQLGDPAYRHMMTGAVKVRSWTGFNGTVTVWRLHHP